jgi:uncharacterized protein DUF3617
MKTILTVTAVLLTGWIGVALPADVPLKPGSYVITSSVEMNGRGIGTPNKSRPRCLKAEDMKDVENVFSPNSYSALGRNKKCQVTNLVASATKFTYVLDCPLTTDHIEVTVSGDSFKETRSAAGKSGGGRSITTVTKVDGSRVGDCK